MLLARKRHRYFDVPVQDLVLRISGPESLYEEARASGMEFWEQVQAYSIRDPAFRASKRAITVPESAPDIVREMAAGAAVARVGPMFTFHGALTEYVGRRLAARLSEVVVSCEGDHYVVTRRAARLPVYPPSSAGPDGLAVVVRPELGPQGIASAGRFSLLRGPADALVVVARSCILADAGVAAATAILNRSRSLERALSYLRRLPGVHGGIVLWGERIGLAGSVELAA